MLRCSTCQYSPVCCALLGGSRLSIDLGRDTNPFVKSIALASLRCILIGTSHKLGLRRGHINCKEDKAISRPELPRMLVTHFEACDPGAALDKTAGIPARAMNYSIVSESSTAWSLQERSPASNRRRILCHVICSLRNSRMRKLH